MTQAQKVIKAKLGLLELGRQLGNISHACRLLGYSRQTYYDYQGLVEKRGQAALAEVSRPPGTLMLRQDADGHVS